MEADEIEATGLTQDLAQAATGDLADGIREELVFEQCIQLRDGEECLRLAFITPAHIPGIPQRQPDEGGVLPQMKHHGTDPRDGLHHAFFMQQGHIEAGERGGFTQPFEILPAPVVQAALAALQTEQGAMREQLLQRLGEAHAVLILQPEQWLRR